VATLKSHGPALQTIENDPLWLNRWEVIELGTWTKEQAKVVSRETKVALDNFDGTPLSVIRPTAGMRILYLGLDEDSKALLRSLKFLGSVGLSGVSGRTLEAVYTSTLFGKDAKTFGTSLAKVKREGFLSKCDREIEAYEPFLEHIADWRYERGHAEFAIDIFSASKLTSELLLLGQQQDRMGMVVIAERAFSAALELDPSSERTHYSLGLFSSRRRDFKDAEKHFLEAARLAPSWKWPWVRLANIYEKLNDVANRRTAVARFRQIDKEHSSPTRDQALAHCSLAAVYWQDSLFDESLSEYRRAIELNNQLPSAFYGIGRILNNKSKWVEAEAAFRRAIRLAPRWAEPRLGIAEPLQHMGKMDLAVAEIRKAIKLFPSFYVAYAVLADLLVRRAKHSQAIDLLLEAIVRFPSSAKLYSLLGEAYDGLRENAKAKVAYEAARDVDPGYASAYVGLAKQYRLSNEFDSAIQANNEAITLRPDFAEPYFGLGLCYLKQKDLDAAERNFLQAIDLKPDFKEAHYYMAFIFEERKQFESALVAVNRAIALGFKNKNSHLTQERIRASLERNQGNKKFKTGEDLEPDVNEPIVDTPETGQD
jgi:tetratricopeptide (TPR) repeat protein